MSAPRQGPPLHDAIFYRGDSQRSFFAAARFRDPDPFDGLGLIRLLCELLLKGEQPRLAVFGKVVDRDVIHAAGPCVG